MLSRADRERRARDVREQLRLYLLRTHDRRNEAVRAVPRELIEARDQLDLLIKLETPAGTQQNGKEPVP